MKLGGEGRWEELGIGKDTIKIYRLKNVFTRDMPAMCGGLAPELSVLVIGSGLQLVLSILASVSSASSILIIFKCNKLRARCRHMNILGAPVRNCAFCHSSGLCLISP